VSGIPYLGAHGESWNPTTGCSKVSPGCANCWAETVSHRFSMTHLPWTPEHAAENVTVHPARLEEPLHWRTPRTVAVCFMGDLFHEQVPDSFIDEVVAVMTATKRHTFLVLTKRAERMRAYFEGGWGLKCMWPAPNVWLGVTAENQRMADERIPLLLDTPGKHWVSLEPLLGAVDIDEWIPCGDPQCEEEMNFLDWVVVGGESGPGHRPMPLEWATDIQAQCEAAGTPFYFKQIAASRPGQPSGVAALDAAKAVPW
jgi:protein gp37